MGEAVRVDLIHWIEIRGLRTKGYGLLILRIYFGSDGGDRLGARAAAELAGDELPRRRSAGVSRIRPPRGRIKRDLGREGTTRYA